MNTQKFSIEQKFENKRWNYAHFNKILEDITKVFERPFYKRGVYSRKTINDLDYTFEELENLKKSGDIEAMRRVCRSFYSGYSSFRRMIDFFACLYMYYYTLDLSGVSREKYNGDIEKLYYNTLTLLDNFNIPLVFEEISQKVLVEGCFFGYVTEVDKKYSTVTELDPRYCRSRFQSCYGTKVIEFNLRYFDSLNNDEDKDFILSKFPEEIRKQYILLKNNIINNEWVILPPHFGICFYLDDTMAPPMYDLLLDILNYNLYKDLEKKKDSSELKKILVQKFNLDEESDLDVLMEEMGAVHKATSKMLSEHDSINVLTTFADQIQMLDTDSSSKSITYTNLNKMLSPVYESAGVSKEIFSSTTSTSLERNIENATSFMSKLIYQYQSWLSIYCYSKFNYQKLFPQVTILPITWYNRTKMADLYLKNAQYGYSWILPYVASGKKQSQILDSNYIEQNILGLGNKLRPLQSSFTQTTDSSGQVGRPELPKEEKSEKTLANIESK